MIDRTPPLYFCLSPLALRRSPKFLTSFLIRNLNAWLSSRAILPLEGDAHIKLEVITPKNYDTMTPSGEQPCNAAPYASANMILRVCTVQLSRLDK